MKKRWIIVAVCIVLFVMGAATLTTRTASYTNLVVSAAGAETDLVAASGYNVGVPAPGTTALEPKDLLKKFGAGKDSYANAIELICYATASDNNTTEMSLYGISDGGPPLRMAGLVYIFGTAIRSSGVRWADTCTVTDVHGKTIAASDSGNDRVVKVNFDVSGYRYLYMIVHGTATGAATAITVQMRPY